MAAKTGPPGRDRLPHKEPLGNTTHWAQLHRPVVDLNAGGSFAAMLVFIAERPARAVLRSRLAQTLGGQNGWGQSLIFMRKKAGTCPAGFVFGCFFPVDRGSRKNLFTLPPLAPLAIPF